MSISSTASQGRAMIFRLISSTATKTATKGHTFAGVRYRLFHNSDQTLAGKIWRQSVGLPKLQTSTISIIDSPDYSFVDGRPVPLSVGQMKRLQVQEQLAKDSVEGLKYLQKSKNMFDKLVADNTPQLLHLKPKAQPRSNESKRRAMRGSEEEKKDN